MQLITFDKKARQYTKKELKWMYAFFRKAKVVTYDMASGGTLLLSAGDTKNETFMYNSYGRQGVLVPFTFRIPFQNPTGVETTTDHHAIAWGFMDRTGGTFRLKFSGTNNTELFVTITMNVQWYRAPNNPLDPTEVATAGIRWTVRPKYQKEVIS